MLLHPNNCEMLIRLFILFMLQGSNRTIYPSEGNFWLHFLKSYLATNKICGWMSSCSHQEFLGLAASQISVFGLKSRSILNPSFLIMLTLECDHSSCWLWHVCVKDGWSSQLTISIQPSHLLWAFGQWSNRWKLSVFLSVVLFLPPPTFQINKIVIKY